jgi:hypothetical protein
VFLKRIRVPTIKRDDLFVGSSITVSVSCCFIHSTLSVFS